MLLQLTVNVLLVSTALKLYQSTSPSVAMLPDTISLSKSSRVEGDVLVLLPDSLLEHPHTNSAQARIIDIPTHSVFMASSSPSILRVESPQDTNRHFGLSHRG